ncbi:F-box/LRR-repeat protein 7-like [Achroia grisella]|uniref:F-box/LRR-repeat protein 7-like n=1 Tax=Achroia grisella TaxID=688607 RepID=UPI0027D2C880|nr:F-box/LRR-repeat protein 7-like [Achroia grisella]
METLPEEVILMIFEYLPFRTLIVVAQVCQRWKYLLRRRLLEVRRQEDLRRSHCGIIAVLISGSIDSLSSCMTTVVDVIPHLRQLTIHATYPLGARCVDDLLRLRHLDHLDVFIQERRIESRWSPLLLRLSSLVINETLTPGVLISMAAGERLRCLNMYGRSWHFPARELTPVLQARREHLTELTLRCTELADAAFEIIGRCERLTSLQLYSCWLLTSRGAQHVVRPRGLRRLHVTGARMLRSGALHAFVRSLPPALEDLCLSAGRFEDEHAPPLARRLPGLKAFELWRCEVTSHNILKMVREMPALRTLDLDIVLSEVELASLTKHPSLSYVRYLFKKRSSEVELKEVYMNRRCGGESYQPYLRGLPQRGGGEGYRASLFYYWTQDRRLPVVVGGSQDNEEFVAV